MQRNCYVYRILDRSPRTSLLFAEEIGKSSQVPVPVTLSHEDPTLLMESVLHYYYLW